MTTGWSPVRWTAFAQVCREEIRLVYIDESHFHRDMDLGYTHL